MWKTNKGPCNCYWCSSGKEHPDRHQKFMTSLNGHLQIAESLDPKDIVRTVMCTLCTHEETRDGRTSL